jgi:hypothetical protein
MILLIGYVALHALIIVGTFFGLIPGVGFFSGLFKGFGVFTLIFAFFLGYGALLLSNFGTRVQVASPLGGPPIPPVPPAPPAPPPVTPPPAPSTPYP